MSKDFILLITPSLKEKVKRNFFYDTKYAETLCKFLKADWRIVGKCLEESLNVTHIALSDCRVGSTKTGSPCAVLQLHCSTDISASLQKKKFQTSKDTENCLCQLGIMMELYSDPLDTHELVLFMELSDELPPPVTKENEPALEEKASVKMDTSSPSAGVQGTGVKDQPQHASNKAAVKMDITSSQSAGVPGAGVKEQPEQAQDKRTSTDCILEIEPVPLNKSNKRMDNHLLKCCESFQSICLEEFKDIQAMFARDFHVRSLDFQKCEVDKSKPAIIVYCKVDEKEKDIIVAKKKMDVQKKMAEFFMSRNCIGKLELSGRQKDAIKSMEIIMKEKGGAELLQQVGNQDNPSWTTKSQPCQLEMEPFLLDSKDKIILAEKYGTDCCYALKMIWIDSIKAMKSMMKTKFGVKSFELVECEVDLQKLKIIVHCDIHPDDLRTICVVKKQEVQNEMAQFFLKRNIVKKMGKSKRDTELIKSLKIAITCRENGKDLKEELHRSSEDTKGQPCQEPMMVDPKSKKKEENRDNSVQNMMSNRENEKEKEKRDKNSAEGSSIQFGLEIEPRLKNEFGNVMPAYDKRCCFILEDFLNQCHEDFNEILKKYSITSFEFKKCQSEDKCVILYFNMDPEDKETMFQIKKMNIKGDLDKLCLQKGLHKLVDMDKYDADRFSNFNILLTERKISKNVASGNSVDPKTCEPVNVKLFVYCEKETVGGILVKLTSHDNRELALTRTKDPHLWKTEVELMTPKKKVTFKFSVFEPREGVWNKFVSFLMERDKFKEVISFQTVSIDEQDIVFDVQGDNKWKYPMFGYDAIFNHFISLPGRNLRERFKDVKTLTMTFRNNLNLIDKEFLLLTLIKNMETALQDFMDVETARRIFCVVLLAEKYLHMYLHNVKNMRQDILHKVLVACRFIDTKTEEATDEDMKHIFHVICIYFFCFQCPDKSFMDYIIFVSHIMPPAILIDHFVRMKNTVPVMIKDNHFKTFSELFFVGIRQEEFIPLVLTLQRHLPYELLLAHVTQCFESLSEEDRATAMCKQTIQNFVSITKDLMKNEWKTEGVVAVWQAARQFKFCSSQDFCEVFQTVFIRCLRNTKQYGRWDIRREEFLFLYQDIADGNVFKTNKDQHELLNVICSSQNDCVLNTFIEILNAPNILVLLREKELETVCRAWIISWSKFLENQKKVEHTCSLYYAFNHLFQSETIKRNKSLVSFLSTFILDHVRKDKLKLFGQIAAMGKENISDVNTLVLEHVGKLLTKLDMEKANEFILQIFPSDNIQIDSRLLAEVLVHFMKITKEDYFPNDGDGDDDVVYFNKILLTQNIFWNKITHASGPGAEQFLFSSELYQQHEAIIKKMVDLFDKGDILLKDFRSLYKQQENYHDIVEKFTAKNKYQLKNMFDDFAETVNGAGADMELTITTLERISLRMPRVIRNDINRYKREIIDARNKLSLGRVSLSTIANRNFLPATFVNTMQCIKDLETVTGCQTFWNCSAGIVHDMEAQFQSHDVANSVEGDEETLQNLTEYSPMGYYKVVEMCLQRLQTDGIRSYEERWAPLFEIEDVPLSDLKILFQHLGTTVKDLQLVIETAKKHQKKCLPLKIDIALKRYFGHVEYEERVRIISDCLAVIGIDAANDPLVREALQNYENLKAEKEEELTLYKINDCIGVIDSFRVEGHVLHVSRVLANSSELLKFLGDIKDVDIGNLTDAVEEHSEQHIQESTVSDLIDVKRFLQPVLAAMPFKDSQEFFGCLDDAVKCSEMADKLYLKIHSCNQFVFSLQNLYRNIANRGEVTKEILKHISTEGVFCFIMPKGGDCELKIKYGSHQDTHDMSKIEDLRSRALLIASAKNKNMAGDNMEEFIFRALDLIELSLDICKLCSSLKSMGHLSFENYQQEKAGKELEALKKELKCEHKQWTRTLNKYRDEYSQLNFLNGTRLLTLFSFLSKGNHEAHATMLMKFINHDFVDMGSLKCMYERLSSLRGNDNVDRRLKDVGKALDLIFTNEAIPRQEFPEVNWDPITSGVVKTGRAHVIALEENSNLVHRVLLCLFYQNGRSLPKANNVLFCDADTEKDEIFLLMRRSRIHKQELFSLVNVQILPTELQTFIINEVHEYQRCQYQFRLAVLCCGGKTHSFLEQFTSQVEDCKPLTEIQIRDVLEALCPDVFVITSQLPGLGKTEMIYEVASTKDLELKTFHISGEFNKETYIQRLLGLKLKDSDLLHIDLGDVADACRTDIFLFELIVLGYVSTQQSAFALPTKNICIEVANSFSSLLREKYNTIFFFKHRHLQWKNAQIIASQDTRSPMQIVCYYLKAVKENFENVADIDLKQVQALPPRECIDLVVEHLDVMPSVSFAIMNIFLNVLAEQLTKLSSSVYFKSEMLESMAGEGKNADVKTSLVNALVGVSSDFATRSVETCKTDQLASLNYKAKSKAEQMTERVGSLQKWEASNHLMLLFHANSQTISAIFKDIKSVPVEIKNMFERQLRKNLENFDKLNAGELLQLLERLTTIKPSKDAEKRLETYALTVDNFLKMVLISLRTQAHVPVIVMGETGCGKTSLIRFLAAVCGIKLEVLSIHAGITEQYIFDFVAEINKEAMEAYNESFWIFMDEINTCAHLGLIADILCHHMLLGKRLAANVTILAACNPYRIRAESAVSKTGLQGARVKEDELSRLVYRVHPLPENMIDFVWDYGSLPSNDEMLYIQRMVQKWSKDEVSTIFAQLLVLSQNFIRQKNNNDYCTSLRDVDRCINLAKWFNVFEAKKPTQCRCNDNKKLKVKCIILALTLGYYCRLETAEDRHEYRQKIIDATKDSKLPGLESEEKIQEMISKEQKFILDSMELPLGIAQNVALQENVFVMLHCILNRIPVFLIGKPGCSKSLSMQLIRSNLRGKDSKNKLFQELPSLNCVAFQGSESCTSDGIVKVFQKAEKFQEYNKEKNVLSVVILDEIGLAGISPFNPLKVLHSLLEPNGKSVPDVAVVGISNWALDASKMNRGIHLSRPEMNEKDLAETGKLISQSLVKTKPSSVFGTSTYDRKRSDIIRLPLNDVASCYCEYYKKQRHPNFHGLRDFYFFTKYISRSVLNLNQEKRLKPLKSIDDTLRHGLWRNFGGLAFDDVFEKFAKCFFNPQKQNIIPDLNQLILENLQDKDARHLMLITTGDVVLDQLVSLLTTHKMEHQVILGSRFQEDCTDDYNYRILNKIILCMEQNLVLILRDLGVYGSLYDMLNQNYTVVGPRKNCRVAIGPYSNPMCYVNDDFKCIVLVDESKLDFSDPPFLNRFEKQHFGLAGQLDKEKDELTVDIEATLKDLSGTGINDFNIDSFIPHFSENLVPSLMLQLSQNRHNFYVEHDTVVEQSLKILIHACHPESMVRMTKSHGWDMYNALAEKLQEFYYQLPVHNGLEHFINKMGILSVNPPQRDIFQGKRSEDDFLFDNQSEGDVVFDSLLDEMLKGENSSDFLVFTHSSYHLNLKDTMKIHGVMIERLGSIKSEKQLSNLIEDYLASNNKLLLMQLRAGIDSIHLQMVKHCMETLRSKEIKSPDMKTRKRFMLLCHLERTDGRNIMTEMTYLSKWHIFTVSDLEANPVELSNLLNMSMVEAMDSVLSLRQVILDSLSWVFIRIKYTQIDDPMKHIEELEDKISKSEFALGLLESIVRDQMTLVSEKEPDWLLKLALDQHMLYHCSTFYKAVESKIRQSIKHVLAKVMLRLEEMGIFNCIFLQDDLLTQRKAVIKSTVLENKMTQKEILNLDSIPAPKGLDFYKCSSSEVALKFPFSRLVFKKVEEYSAEYMDFMKQIQDPDLESLSDEQVEGLNQIFIEKLDGKLRMLSELKYSACQTDYFGDFVWMSLETFSSNLKSDKSHKIFKWTLEKMVSLETLVDQPLSVVCITVHSTIWRHSSIFSNVQTMVEKSHQGFGLDVDYLLSRQLVKVEFEGESQIDKAVEDLFYVDEENLAEDVDDVEAEDSDQGEGEVGAKDADLKEKTEADNYDDKAEDVEGTDDDDDDDDVAEDDGNLEDNVGIKDDEGAEDDGNLEDNVGIKDDEGAEDDGRVEDNEEPEDDEEAEVDEGTEDDAYEQELKYEVKKECHFQNDGEEYNVNDDDDAEKFDHEGATFVSDKDHENDEDKDVDTDDEYIDAEEDEGDREKDNSDREKGVFEDDIFEVQDVDERGDNAGFHETVDIVQNEVEDVEDEESDDIHETEDVDSDEGKDDDDDDDDDEDEVKDNGNGNVKTEDIDGKPMFRELYNKEIGVKNSDNDGDEDEEKEETIREGIDTGNNSYHINEDLGASSFRTDTFCSEKIDNDDNDIMDDSVSILYSRDTDNEGKSATNDVYTFFEHERMNGNTSAKDDMETDDENAMDSSEDWKETLVHKIVMEIFPARASVIASHKDILRWYKSIRGFISEMGQLAYIHLLEIISFLSDVAVEIFIKNADTTKWQLFLQMSRDIVQGEFRMDTSEIAPKFVEYFEKLDKSKSVTKTDIQIILSTFFELAFQGHDDDDDDADDGNDGDDQLSELWCLLPKVYTMDPYLTTLRPALERMLSTIDAEDLLDDQKVGHFLQDVAARAATEDLKSSLTKLVRDIVETQILPSILPQQRFLDIDLHTDPLVENFLSAICIYKDEEKNDNYPLAVAYIKYFLHVSLQLILAGEVNSERIDLFCSIYNNLSDDESEHPNETTSSKVQQLQQFFFSVLELLRDRNSVKGSLKNVKFVTSDRLLSVYDHMCRRPVMIYDMKTYHQVVVNINLDLNSDKVEKMKEYCNAWQKGNVDKLLVYGGILEVFFMGKLLYRDKAISKDFLVDLSQLFENTAAISAESQRVLNKLSGSKDFGSTKYHLNTGTEYCQWHLVSFLTHLLLVTSAGNTTSILFACTFKKDILQQRYFPGTGLQTPKDWVCYHVTCSCGYRVTSDKHCAHCGHQPDPFKYDYHLEACEHRDLKTLLLNEDISVGAKAIIRMIMYGSCLNAFAMETGNAAYIQTFFAMEKGQKLEDYLWNNLNEDWNMLRTSLFLSHNELCLFLHSVLKSCRKILDDAKCSTKKEKEQVVKDLAQEIDALLQARFQVLSDLKSEFLDFKDGKEATPVVEDSELRLIALPTLQNLQLEASLVPSAKHPLLSYLLKNLDILQLPKHITPLLDWTRTMYKFANNRFLKVEVKEMYMDNVFDRETDFDRRESLKKMFRAFQDTWNTVRNKLPDYCEHLDMPMMETNLSAEFCLCFDVTSVISKVLMHLVQIHNVIIDDILFLTSKNDSNVSSLRQWQSEDAMALIPWVELDKVGEANLVSLDIDETLLSFSGHPDGFNYGRTLQYNLDIIEKDITRGCLRDVAYIVPKKLEPIVFLDETYKNSRDVLNNIKNNIPQEGITPEMINDILKRQTEASQFSQLLPHLGTVLALVNKTKGNPHTPLTEYIDKWKKLIPNHKEMKALMPESEHSIELRHIVSLYMLLEQLNGENLFRTNQIPKEYTQDIPYEAREVLEDCAKIDVRLLHFTLRALQVFTHRCLQGETTDHSKEKDKTLCDTLSDESFWPIGVSIHVKGKEWVLCLPHVPEVMFAQVIPIPLKLAHVRSTMTCLKDIIERLDRMAGQTRLMALKTGTPSSRDKDKSLPPAKRKRKL